MTQAVLLIDGVCRQDALRWLYGTDASPEVLPLYAGTRWRQLMAHGPILARLEPNSPLLRAWQGIDRALQGQASLLFSEAPVGELARHLRQFIRMRDADGHYSLVRFADPRVTAYWLDSYPEAGWPHVLGPIREWHVTIPVPAWDSGRNVTSRVFKPSAEQAPYEQPLDLLGPAQVDALLRACRQVFNERLYRQLQILAPHALEPLAPELRGRWLEQSLDEAVAWGVSGERGAALWAVCRARWGEGFDLEHEGPFQRCLANLPAARRLPHDAQLQAVVDALLT